MASIPECAFCDVNTLSWRTIRINELFLSVVSVPNFRDGHCLVIPRAHVTKPQELNREQGSEIMQELGRLSVALDEGFGSGIMQKYQPLQPENGTKMNHLHFHVFPRMADEIGLFPVPEPNNFEGFEVPKASSVQRLAQSLR